MDLLAFFLTVIAAPLLGARPLVDPVPAAFFGTATLFLFVVVDRRQVAAPLLSARLLDLPLRLAAAALLSWARSQVDALIRQAAAVPLTGVRPPIDEAYHCGGAPDFRQENALVIRQAGAATPMIGAQPPAGVPDTIRAPRRPDAAPLPGARTGGVDICAPRRPDAAAGELLLRQALTSRTLAHLRKSPNLLARRQPSLAGVVQPADMPWRPPWA